MTAVGDAVLVATDSAASISSLIKSAAYGLGFDLVGITTLGPAASAPAFKQWLERGFDGEMAYLERGAEKRSDTRLPYPGARSAVVVAMNYGGTAPSGPVAKYARGEDYHDVMVERLHELHGRVDQLIGTPVRGKAYVDTGPMLERDLARRAGLGWFGKNTNLLNPGLGSFFFLGALLLEADLVADAPFETDHCGTCTRCIEACPTGAIVEARVLDATKCLSYTTIELRGPIPEEFRAPQADLLYGCDICQDVCPWNVKFARDAKEPAFAPRPAIASRDARTLARDLLAMNDEEFRAAFRGSPMKRAKLRGLKRNATVVLGNVGTSEDVPVLTAALSDPEPLVREHAAWALEQLRTRS